VTRTSCQCPPSQIAPGHRKQVRYGRRSASHYGADAGGRAEQRFPRRRAMTRSSTAPSLSCSVVFSSSRAAICIGSTLTPLRARRSSVIASSRLSVRGASKPPFGPVRIVARHQRAPESAPRYPRATASPRSSRRRPRPSPCDRHEGRGQSCSYPCLIPDDDSHRRQTGIADAAQLLEDDGSRGAVWLALRHDLDGLDFVFDTLRQDPATTT
jgi:hypothetical protein